MSEFGRQAEEKMKKALEVSQQGFNSIRAGRAAPSLLDRLQVEYYGSKVSLKQLATVSVPDSKTLLIQPFDKGSVGDIERAIQKSDLGLTPNAEGGAIRLNIPPLTEERRKELVKVIKKTAEDGKIVIRNIRRDVLDVAKHEEKDGKLSKDQVSGVQEEVQKLTDKYNKQIDQLLETKEKEVMSV